VGEPVRIALVELPPRGHLRWSLLLTSALDHWQLLLDDLPDEAVEPLAQPDEPLVEPVEETAEQALLRLRSWALSGAGSMRLAGRG
jgi:hypothetical protein